MKIRRLAIILASLAAASLACGLGNLLPGGSEGLTTTSELWADVPRVEGLDGSDLELPLAARVFMEAWMSAVLSGGTGNGSVAVFNTQKTAAELQSFYTNERMTSSGWQSSEESTCFSGSEQGIAEIGLFCAFVKEAATQQTGLMLIAIPSEQQGRMEVFFVRLENLVTPAP